MRPLAIETVDDQPAVTSPYRKALLAAGFVSDFKVMVLDRRF